MISYDEKLIRQLKIGCEKIKNNVYKPIAALKAEAWITPEPVPFERRMEEGKRKAISVGDKWGELFDCAWFNFTGQVPESAKGKKVVLMIDLGGEGCVFDSEGCPVRGLTNITGPEHLERLKREKDLNGLAPVKQEHAIDFFKKLDAKSSRYNSWFGELYLEKHQGTLTSQAKNKWYNRKMEIALREAEFSSTLALIYAQKPYMKTKLEEIWKEVLLYQFHDILPGSSIKRVYDESVERYSILLEQVNNIIESSYSAVTEKIAADYSENSYMVYNSLSWERDEWLFAGGSWHRVNVPPMSCKMIDAGKHEDLIYSINTGEGFIENDIIKVHFNADGTICSIFDKECGCEVLDGESPANKLAVYEDEGDAWDFSIDYRNRCLGSFRIVSSEVIKDGPKAIMRQHYEYGKSKLIQDIVVTAGSRRIDFATSVDWQESGKMLRTSFPVNIHTDTVTCNIQYGSIKRPTYENTSWDRAKFEICAHKWVDLSRKDYGVALMNDCKYGHYVRNNIMDLNLLRSTQEPGKDADKGYHTFTYALYPHKGDEVEGQVNRRAYEMNIPFNLVKIVKAEGLENPLKPFVEIDAANIIVESVKKAEDSDDIIIRLYESCGFSTEANIKLGIDAETVQLVNLMEEYENDVEIENEKIKLKFKPFEILTLKVGI